MACRMLYTWKGWNVPSIHTLTDIFLVMSQGQLIQIRLRFEVDNLKLLAAVLEAVAQDIDQALHIDRTLKSFIRPPDPARD